MAQSLKRTPFFGSHVAAGARLIDFGGWEMPVRYTGIQQEHRDVRAGVGLFDVSHMGEIRVQGPGAQAAINHMTCNDVRKVAVGTSQYSAILNERGGIVDDIFVYRLGEQDFLICVNASNRDKDFAWLQGHNIHKDAEFTDQGAQWAQLAIQGRHGVAVTQSLTSVAVTELVRGGIVQGDFAGVDGCWLARTGYTGEDGFEVFIPMDQAKPTWDRTMAAGESSGIIPVGLGARDTLRLEVKNVLYGNDINEDTTPYEARLGWITRLDKGQFIGREALVAQREAGVPRFLSALVVEKRIGRPHNPILVGDSVIGEVTSGTRSPSLGTNIAMGYVARGHGRPGTALTVDVRGKPAAARVVKPPFYVRDY
jgi:aminomethyltransferase